MPVSADGTITATPETPETQETVASDAGTGATPQQTQPPANPDEVQFVQQGGKDFIPREAFEARLGAMTAKQKALEEVVDRFRTGNQSSAPTTTPQAGQAAEENFLAPYQAWRQQAVGSDPQAGAFFDNYTGMILNIVDKAVQSYIGERLGEEVSPIKERFAKTEEEGFFNSNKEAAARRAEIDATMKKYPGIDRDAAWKLVNYDRAVQGNKPAGNLRKPPPAAGPRTTSAPPNTKPKGLSNLISNVLDQAGV